MGDQFTLIALPWLVLRLTGDLLALGLVLALARIPRAAFMLLDGAVTDRFSPRRIMLEPNLIRLVPTGLIAGAILTKTIQSWTVFVFSLAFGTVAGFFTPGSNSMLPTLVARTDSRRVMPSFRELPHWPDSLVRLWQAAPRSTPGAQRDRGVTGTARPLTLVNARARSCHLRPAIYGRQLPTKRSGGTVKRWFSRREDRHV